MNDVKIILCRGWKHNFGILSILTLPWMAYGDLTITAVEPVNWSNHAAADVSDAYAYRPLQHNGKNSSLAYYIGHFHRLANAVRLEEPNRGFIDLKVWRRSSDNEPYNARIMENITSLAWVYARNELWNPYYGDAATRQRLETALDFWVSIQHTDGRFSEYGARDWNLAATAFAAKFASEALVQLNGTPPIDADVHERVRQATRKAILGTLDREEFWSHATRFTNQYGNAFAGAMAYLHLYNDPEVAISLERQMVRARDDFLSPAGYLYEADGPDWGYYFGTHHSNIHMAWHYGRNRVVNGTHLGDLIAAEYEKSTEWLAYNAVPQPDGKRFFLNRSIETRQTQASFNRLETPLSEVVELARAFSVTEEERQAQLAWSRNQLENHWGNPPDLSVNSFSSYSPYAFLHRDHARWYPTEEQRQTAYQDLPYISRDYFTHQRMDDRIAHIYTYVRRPGYYLAFNSGPRERDQPRRGIGLLWHPDFGTLIQSQTGSTEFAWGTRRLSDNTLREAFALSAAFSIDDEPVAPKTGIYDFEPGSLRIDYAMKEGQKHLRFTDWSILVSVTEADGNGRFVEQIPLLMTEADQLVIENGQVKLLRNGLSILHIAFMNAESITLQQGGRIDGLDLVAVHATATDALEYEIRVIPDGEVVINAPFNLAFGSGEERNDRGWNFTKNIPGEWQLREESLRLLTTAEDYHYSLATSPIENYQVGDAFLLEAKMTLSELATGTANNRVGLVLFGDENWEIFDADDDGTFYTFQWTPNGDSGGSIAVRGGGKDHILAEVNFADLENPPLAPSLADPTAGIGTTYTFRFATKPNDSGGLSFFALLADDQGGQATLSGDIQNPTSGNRFGLGAWHRGDQGPVWDFHRFNWLSMPALTMPLNVKFGTLQVRDDDASFLKSGYDIGNWSLEEKSLRHSRPFGSMHELIFESSTAVTNVVDYTSGQDFVVRSTVTPSGLESFGDNVKHAFLDFPEAEDYVILGTSGMNPHSGTVEMMVYFVDFDGVWIYGHHSPVDVYSNRFQIKYAEIGFGNNANAISVGTTEVNQWLRLSVSYDETTVWYYIDGELKGAVNRPNGFNVWADKAYLMNVGPVGNNNRGPTGKVADVRHWNYARSQVEIQTAMNQRLDGDESGLVGYWLMDAGAGETVLDRSGNGNDGIIVGAQWRMIPQFGLTFLGQSGDGVNPADIQFPDASYRFEWLPFAGKTGELRFSLPNGAIGASLPLPEEPGLPQFAEQSVYTFEIQGRYGANGDLELTGILSDDSGAKATLIYNAGDPGVYRHGNWFGITGNDVVADWHTFEVGTFTQMIIDPGSGLSFTQWQENVFNGTQLLDDNISGPLATPAGDNIPNLFKFAFGFPPFTPVTFSQMIASEVVDGKLRLTYNERVNIEGIEYRPEASTDLRQWNSGPSYIARIEDERLDGGEFYRVTIEAIFENDEPIGFLRIRVIKE
jgi:hypothetical protein